MPKTTQKALKAINKKLEYADSSDLLELMLDVCRNVPAAADFLNVKLGIVQEREFLDSAKTLIDKELSKNHLKYNRYYGQKEFSLKKNKLRSIIKDLKTKTDKTDYEIEFTLYCCYQLITKCLAVYSADESIGISSYTLGIIESLFRSSCNLISKKSNSDQWLNSIEDLIGESNKLFAKTSSYIDYWSGEDQIQTFVNPLQQIWLEFRQI